MNNQYRSITSTRGLPMVAVIFIPIANKNHQTLRDCCHHHSHILEKHNFFFVKSQKLFYISVWRPLLKLLKSTLPKYSIHILCFSFPLLCLFYHFPLNQVITTFIYWTLIIYFYIILDSFISTKSSLDHISLLLNLILSSVHWVIRFSVNIPGVLILMNFPLLYSDSLTELLYTLSHPSP